MAPRSFISPDVLERKAAEAEQRAAAAGVPPEVAATWQRVARNYRWLAQYQLVFSKQLWFEREHASSR